MRALPGQYGLVEVETGGDDVVIVVLAPDHDEVEGLCLQAHRPDVLPIPMYIEYGVVRGCVSMNVRMCMYMRTRVCTHVCVYGYGYGDGCGYA